MGLFDRRRREKGTRIFFATDVHGSEDCFRKFLTAPRFYDADVLVMGGDILGKSLIPIAKAADGYAATFRGRELSGLDSSGFDELTTAIRRGGDYYLVGAPQELERLEDPAELDRTFRAVVVRSMEDWVTLADERLRGTGVRCFVAPGNDDFLEIDDALKGGESVVFAEGRVLKLDDGHEVMTTGYSNPTPWRTERELEEPEMRTLLERMASEVSDMENAVAVIHPPPYDCGLDLCPALDDDFRVQSQGGEVTMAPVGSTAVRDFLREHQPLLGLHGHVHEGKGSCEIGRTRCVNPGSEYGDGVLAGAIVEIGDRSILAQQFVVG